VNQVICYFIFMCIICDAVSALLRLRFCFFNFCIFVFPFCIDIVIDQSFCVSVRLSVLWLDFITFIIVVGLFFSFTI